MSMNYQTMFVWREREIEKRGDSFCLCNRHSSWEWQLISIDNCYRNLLSVCVLGCINEKQREFYCQLFLPRFIVHCARCWFPLQMQFARTSFFLGSFFAGNSHDEFTDKRNNLGCEPCLEDRNASFSLVAVASFSPFHHFQFECHPLKFMSAK